MVLRSVVTHAKIRRRSEDQLETYDAEFSLALVVGDGYEYIDRDDEQRAVMLSVTAEFLLGVICKRESERTGISARVAGKPFDSDHVVPSDKVRVVHEHIVLNCAKLGITLT